MFIYCCKKEINQRNCSSPWILKESLYRWLRFLLFSFIAAPTLTCFLLHLRTVKTVQGIQLYFTMPSLQIQTSYYVNEYHSDIHKHNRTFDTYSTQIRDHDYINPKHALLCSPRNAKMYDAIIPLWLKQAWKFTMSCVNEVWDWDKTHVAEAQTKQLLNHSHLQAICKLRRHPQDKIQYYRYIPNHKHIEACREL